MDSNPEKPRFREHREKKNEEAEKPRVTNPPTTIDRRGRGGGAGGRQALPELADQQQQQRAQGGRELPAAVLERSGGSCSSGTHGTAAEWWGSRSRERASAKAQNPPER